MIALDLDRTTLREDGTIPERVAVALNEAGRMGAMTVVATGRTFDALPASLSSLEYVKYYICSNGAAVFGSKKYDKDAEVSTVMNRTAPEKPRREDVEMLYEKCLDPTAVETMVGYVKEKGYMFESFTDGHAYIGRDFYELVDAGLLMYRSREYVVNTRTPVDDIFEFTLGHKERIENLNVFFPSQKEKDAFRPLLAAIPNATLTSSVPSNYELGGEGVSKGAALEFLMDLEGITASELLAAGDSPNDITMLKLAGCPVAVANAEEPVKEAACYIAPSNEEGGIADAVQKYVLQDRL